MVDFNIDEMLTQAGQDDSDLEADIEIALNEGSEIDEPEAELDPECPTKIDEIDRLLEKLPLCRKELLAQVEARKKSGAAKSDNEAAKQIAEETGKKPETVRKQIQRARKDELGQVSQPKGRPSKLQQKPEKKAQKDPEQIWLAILKKLDALTNDMWEAPKIPVDLGKKSHISMHELFEAWKANGKTE